MYDLIIKGGLIMDGTGKRGFVADIGVINDWIVKIGDLEGAIGQKSIDAQGLVVSPGFIDVHSHSDWNIFKTIESENVIRQGITTEITGQCGNSAFPVMNEKVYDTYEYFRDKVDNSGILDWRTGEEFFKKAEQQGLSGNIASLVGHGAIRQNIMGYENRRATEQELQQMRDLVEEAMQDGAFGISSGLPYPPGCYGDLEEVKELCKVVKKYGGVYATHMKTMGRELVETVLETIGVGESTGVKVNISHLKAGGKENWGKSSELVKVIDDARNRGVEVIYDFYPYTGASNPLMLMFPKWLFEGSGKEKLIEGLSSADARERARAEMPCDRDEYWDIIVIGDLHSEKNKWLRGKTIRQAAECIGKTPFDAACDLLIEEEGEVNVVVIAMCEEDIKVFAAYPFAAVGTDGRAISERDYKGHPRAFGTFPLFLGRCIREQKITTLEDGVRRITSLPAEFIGIRDRGIIDEGKYADIVIFDQDRIIDHATYENPNLYPEGIEYVIVNGSIQLEKGNFIGLPCGRTLRMNI